MTNETHEYLVSIRPKDGDPFRTTYWAANVQEVFYMVNSEYGLEMIEKISVEPV
jgi:hypothetical protein